MSGLRSQKSGVRSQKKEVGGGKWKVGIKKFSIFNFQFLILNSVLCILYSSFAFAGTATTGIMLTPCGNIKKQKGGFGGDLGFVYYIGDLIRKEGDETNYLNRIGSFYFFVDAKASPFANPVAVAIGGEGFVVLKGSQPEEKSKMGGGGDIEGTKVFGFLYLALSKEVMKNGVNLGLLYGPIGKIFNPIIHNLDMEIKDENIAYLASWNTNVLRRGFGIEAIKPKDSNYLLINTSIDRFFGFSFSYLKGDNISSLIGYIGIRLNIH